MSAGLNDPADIAGAQAFAAALHGIERVTIFRDPGSHDFYSFGPAFARVLPWAWSQIAPPTLRVRFPIAGGVTSHSVTVQATGKKPKVLAGQAHNHEPDDDASQRTLDSGRIEHSPRTVVRTLAAATVAMLSACSALGPGRRRTHPP